jgi:AraC family transcriptional regulator
MTEQTATKGYEVRSVECPALRVACLRHLGPYTEVGSTFGRLAAWAGGRGLFGPHAKLLGVFHDDPKNTPPSALRCDCCITVSDDFQPDGDVSVMTVEGGPHAMITHKGPYSELGKAYEWLYSQWLPASGREPRQAPPFEVYINSPQTAAPEELLTEIYLPLQPK